MTVTRYTPSKGCRWRLCWSSTNLVNADLALAFFQGNGGDVWMQPLLDAAALGAGAAGWVRFGAVEGLRKSEGQRSLTDAPGADEEVGVGVAALSEALLQGAYGGLVADDVPNGAMLPCMLRVL